MTQIKVGMMLSLPTKKKFPDPVLKSTSQRPPISNKVRVSVPVYFLSCLIWFNVTLLVTSLLIKI